MPLQDCLCHSKTHDLFHIRTKLASSQIAPRGRHCVITPHFSLGALFASFSLGHGGGGERRRFAVDVSEPQWAPVGRSSPAARREQVSPPIKPRSDIRGTDVLRARRAARRPLRHGCVQSEPACWHTAAAGDGARRRPMSESKLIE